MTTKYDIPDYIERSEIAAKLKVSTKVFREKVETRPDFPRPALRLSRQTVRWDPADVRQWIERERKRA
jgi:predicted DNA-binding transcriptional regulator AlpA